MTDYRPYLPFGDPSHFRQVNPFRPSDQHQPRAREFSRRPDFDPQKDFLRVRGLLRTSVLSVQPIGSTWFRCWEKRKPAQFRLEPQFVLEPLALIGDAPYLDYIVSQSAFKGDKGALYHQAEISVETMCIDLGLGGDSFGSATAAMSRLNNTLITVDNWWDEDFRPKVPLVEARPIAAKRGCYRVTLCEWLSHQIAYENFLWHPLPMTPLSGIEYRLDGWARTFVGGDPRRGPQIISKREAMSRIGYMPMTAKEAWQRIIETVALDQVPDFQFKMIEHGREAAILVTPRPPQPPAPIEVQSESNEITLDWAGPDWPPAEGPTELTLE
ncbi:hypothetical protein [Sphingomonas crocodyli]|uniref:Uncharacterized protein n=1 Tax=Sphingomonas crocodyli TaxID=1979270 RepID=A0A437M665_9SPHN|nr:hypothetical protein [Sphingomonas crocodyli]RVT92994.1 hypothetical protein EOD43_03570 [Sphingomonas crocodyli]